MFISRTPTRLSPQKRRQARMLAYNRLLHKLGWVRMLAVGQGRLTLPMLEQLHVLGKRTTKFPFTQHSFWVGLQAGITVTGKPANLRMGKGKGGRLGVVAKVRSGGVIFACRRLRVGRIRKLERRIQVRCGFRIAADYQSYEATNSCVYVSKRTSRHYVKPRWYGMEWLFLKLNYTAKIYFLGVLFSWTFNKPSILAPLAGLFGASFVWVRNTQDVAVALAHTDIAAVSFWSKRLVSSALDLEVLGTDPFVVAEALLGNLVSAWLSDTTLTRMLGFLYLIREGHLGSELQGLVYSQTDDLDFALDAQTYLCAWQSLLTRVSYSGAV